MVKRFTIGEVSVWFERLARCIGALLAFRRGVQACLALFALCLMDVYGCVVRKS